MRKLRFREIIRIIQDLISEGVFIQTQLGPMVKHYVIFNTTQCCPLKEVT